VSVVSNGQSIVNSNGFVCVFAGSNGQIGGSVANSIVFVVSKKRSVVNSNVFQAFLCVLGLHSSSVVKCCIFAWFGTDFCVFL